MGVSGQRLLRHFERLVRQLIALDPIDVTITRFERIEDEAGFEEQASSHGPFTVRLVPVRDRAALSHFDNSELAGTIYSDTDYSLIALPDVDLRAGAHVWDEFVIDEGRFRILKVHPLRVGGHRYGILAELEKLD